MLSSSLLQHADYKRVLYGGSGYVPEVVFLQRWIEVRCPEHRGPQL